MASKTSYLELTLPLNGEYVDKWDQPINANFEILDDHLSTLNTDLVGSGGDTSDLKGAKASLNARIDIGLNSDGTLKLDTSTDYTILEVSKVYELSTAGDQIQRIVDRFDRPESEIADLRMGSSTNRYGVSGSPSAIRGIGQVCSSYKGTSNEAIQSPIRGFTPNSVVKGPWYVGEPPRPTHMKKESDTLMSISGGADGAWYNIDGMLFNIMNSLEMDFGPSYHAVGVMGDGNYSVWVSRNEADYNTSGNLQWYYSKYNGVSLGGTFQLDPRIIPTHASLRANAPGVDPTDGVVVSSVNTLTSALAAFVTWGVQAGDTIVVSSPSTLAGKYAVDSVTSENEVTIASKFSVSSSAVTFHIERPTVPSFGFVNAVGSMPYTAGRLYIGTFTVASSVIYNVTPYATNGIFDTGWMTISSCAAGPARDHYLGVYPSHVDIWVKSPTGNVFRDPTMRLDINNADIVGGTTYATVATLDVPAFRLSATATEFTIVPTNPLGEVSPFRTFYDGLTAAYVLSSSSTYKVRAILRR